MKKTLLIAAFMLTGCESKDSSTVEQSEFTFSQVTLTLERNFERNYEGEISDHIRGHVRLADNTGTPIELTGQDNVTLSGPHSIVIKGQNTAKDIEEPYCCFLNWSSESQSISDTQSWQLNINRGRKPIDSYPVSFPQFATITYPATQADYDTFAYSGSDVVISWDPNSVNLPDSFTYRIKTLKEGEKCDAKQDSVVDWEVEIAPDDFQPNKQLTIPAKYLSLCPSPIQIEVDLSYNETKTVTSSIYNKSTQINTSSHVRVRLTEQE
ncbi:hypothetical protein [Pseudoalteromonas rubra]|uniref:Lipoprotein n=1 Tax=Pseudoalteromonas rubra TaxID=43658 RepID=A0A0F4QFN8_9GAMM|nr:hypothetical protein [Pseudoalteromonas rubra]KJZ05502.1 hypothetical protein TW77_22630 [Pseudoalteromonas rubra]